MDSKGIRLIKVLSLRKVLGYIQDRQSSPKAIWQQAVIFHKGMDEGTLWHWDIYGQEWLLLGPMQQNGKIVNFWALNYQYRTQNGPLLASSRFL